MENLCIPWILCEKNTLIFISRKGRKGRRTSDANYAIAEVVAGYARQRAQRKNRNGTIHPQRFNERKTETETIHPLRRFAPRPPVSEGQLVSAVFLV